jgi:error-prone DNA polymerase
MSGFAELVASSNFSFLRGASHAEEMAAAAKALGLSAIGIADRNSLAGAVRAWKAGKTCGVPVLTGARLVTADGMDVACYPTDKAAYGRLCRLLTAGNLRAAKGQCLLTPEDILAHAEGQIFILIPPRDWCEEARNAAQHFAQHFAGGDRLYVALVRAFDGRDGARLHGVRQWAQASRIQTIVSGDALYHVPERRALQDAVTCIREGLTIDTAGLILEANAERHLKEPDEMARLFPEDIEAIGRTEEIARRIGFRLDEITYQYPDEVIGEGETAMQTLRRLTEAGGQWRYPTGIPAKVRQSLDNELALIDRRDYAPYFLTVHDLVREARAHGILCQGRGSAANSSVCYCLGVTSVDPNKIDLLFERFVSEERNEPPDIDVDFEHERREEVIQYVYNKYGRDRAAMTATVITYRAKGAVREVAKAMGLSLDMADALSRQVWRWSGGEGAEQNVREIGLDPESPRLKLALALTRELIGFPRHLSQHPGGFVITRDRLDQIVPVMNAAMDDRTMIEWDKDDIESLKMMKVDVLGLGMLSLMARAFELLREHYGIAHELASIPQDDPDVYDMICRADTIGVFQIESRAQMSMLPRLKPQTYYDLVIEVAIVRPGPIQGDMVHPYLRRREGKEEVIYPSKALEDVLSRTLGVPLFQEQAMKIAIVAAGFTPGEADGLRRAMATFRHAGIIGNYEERLIEGMVANGYDRDFAVRCFKQIEGFGEYGFPESHAASFALLVYVSAWVKHHHPDVFLTAILNAQPMGFYASAQLVRCARDHGVEVRPVDVNQSDWDASMEKTPGGKHGYAVRLGLRQVKGMGEPAAARIVAARASGGPFASMEDLAVRAQLAPRTLDALAAADAFGSLTLARRSARWAARGTQAPLPLFAVHGERAADPIPALPAMGAPEEVWRDYQSTSLSLKGHPMQFLRPHYEQGRFTRCADLKRLIDLKQMKNGAWISVSGLVLVRQQPGDSKVVFITLEDETGIANLIVWPQLVRRYRREVLTSRLLACHGRMQSESGVIHVIARQLQDHSDLLNTMRQSGDGAFGDGHMSPADVVKNGGNDPREAAQRKRAQQQKLLQAMQDSALPRSRDFH